MDFEFRPRLGPTILALVSVLVLLALGIWQMARFIEKSAAEDTWAERRRAEPSPLSALEGFDADALDYQQVQAEGTLDTSRLAIFDHHRFRGEPGCLVASPLSLVGGGTVLVVRGFAPHTKQHRCNEAELTAPASTSWLGLVHTPRPNMPDMAGRSQQGDVTRWNAFDVQGAYEVMGITDGPTTPTVIVLDEKHAGAPFPLASYEHVSDPYLTSMRHLNYAGTWFILVLVALALWGALSMRRIDTPEGT